MFRTVKILLEHTVELVETVSLFNQACQRVLDWGQANKQHNKYKLDRATYYDAREEFPSLPSPLVQTARDQASDMLKRDKFKHKIRKKPSSSIRYDKRTLRVFLQSGYLSISTVSGRKRYDFILPDYYRQYQSWMVQNAQLIIGRYACFLNVQVEGETPPFNCGNRRLGIDLGINNIAVCSDNTFYSSKHLKNVKGQYRHLKAELQSIGTRSARRKLREVSGRERRFVRDSNHCVAKEVVSKPYDVFVFEDLKSTREIKRSREFNPKLGSWSFGELIRFVRYKAEALGKRVEVIDPHYTSQTCSRCGHVSSSNRTGRQFECVQCRFTLDADLNASRNIAAFSTWEGGRLSVSQPNAASGEAKGHMALEAEFSCKPVSMLVGS
ncbi:RNA-guided endonuclease InsQ/TnpB family protein [Methanomassiliicoccus luminyensis]|uniref:RNA-guided endonuclease InsQ/TnpB family protein n=1 Tax=Methanomassiliicoccus luminyensis TaxID=1080712 RepID=UPI0006745199|nr:RNA-guided endonuclease TnpB family protein [Methanomassiliicoccus luminyensis]